jgi:hypothetical protein
MELDGALSIAQVSISAEVIWKKSRVIDAKSCPSQKSANFFNDG